MTEGSESPEKPKESEKQEGLKRPEGSEKPERPEGLESPQSQKSPEKPGSPEQAAAIIHGRTRYADYRDGLLVRPADMTEKQAYRWRQRLLICTENPEKMREEHEVRRAVICDSRYGAVGVAAYFRDICAGPFEDEGRRPVYGFTGFIWKIDSFSVPSFFPSREDFQRLIRQYVIPRWEEPKNGKDTEKATLSIYRERWSQTAFGEPDHSDDQLRQALKQALHGEQVFYCENITTFCPDCPADRRSGGEEQAASEDSRNSCSAKRLQKSCFSIWLPWGLMITGILCGTALLAWMLR